MRRHTKVVKDLIEEVCVYDKCRYYLNVWNPFSCMEFVTPAFTLGIPEHLEVRVMLANARHVGAAPGSAASRV